MLLSWIVQIAVLHKSLVRVAYRLIIVKKLWEFDFGFLFVLFLGYSS